MKIVVDVADGRLTIRLELGGDKTTAALLELTFGFDDFRKLGHGAAQ